ncbi:hypothetical protein Q3G72_007201 [Acer saccharum]|nr:hypothetical protein Q3G72_007201 [Acer saccharum]
MLSLPSSPSRFSIFKSASSSLRSPFPAASTGFFYVKKKSSKKLLEKLEFRKYDPRVNHHVLFTEAKMK